ncbi:MAG: hypothetical protein SPL64_06790, partial [Bacteroidaceae bacterium]|nr:hypothetical protein [Bacteroidaceae bacterium]
RAKVAGTGEAPCKRAYNKTYSKLNNKNLETSVKHKKLKENSKEEAAAWQHPSELSLWLPL